MKCWRGISIILILPPPPEKGGVYCGFNTKSKLIHFLYFSCWLPNNRYDNRGIWYSISIIAVSRQAPDPHETKSESFKMWVLRGVLHIYIWKLYVASVCNSMQNFTVQDTEHFQKGSGCLPIQLMNLRTESSEKWVLFLMVLPFSLLSWECYA